MPPNSSGANNPSIIRPKKRQRATIISRTVPFILSSFVKWIICKFVDNIHKIFNTNAVFNYWLNYDISHKELYS